jgi:hypothetical protein
MALSASQRRATEKYLKTHYTQVKLAMPNAEARALEAHCTAFHWSKAGFIRQAIKEKMERDTPPEGETEGNGDGVVNPTSSEQK